MNDHLVFGINEGLAVISLDDAVGSHHGAESLSVILLCFSLPAAPCLGWFSASHLSISSAFFCNFSACCCGWGPKPWAREVYPGPGRFASVLPATAPPWPRSSAFLLELGESAAPFFRGVGRQLAAIQGNMVPPNRFISSQTSSTSLNRGRISSFKEETKAAMVL